MNKMQEEMIKLYEKMLNLKRQKTNNNRFYIKKVKRGRMITGINIKFSKKDTSFFETSFNTAVNTDKLIIALLETVNDICKDAGLNTNEQLKKYIQLGSVDNYTKGV